MTRTAAALSALALLASAPAWAQAARDFQLPPGPTPTPESRVQGPVDPDAPVPVRPRAIETAQPTPTPTASTAPTIVLPAPTPTQAARQTRVPAARPTASASQAPSAAGPAVAPPRASPPSTHLGTASLPLPIPSATGAPAPLAAPTGTPEETPLPWLWIALGGLALAAGGGVFAWRRRSADAAPPEILVPAVAAASSVPGEMLALAVEAVRMDRSVLNATVGYRITVRNRTAQALSGVAIEADLVSASRERPAEQQLASPQQALAPRHAADRIAPGQSLRFEGQVRLPLSEASAIWQGRVGLLVPLLRVRATATNAQPVATTLVIGRSEGQAARPQPFRLDEPPRSYAPLAQRVLDAVPARA